MLGRLFCCLVVVPLFNGILDFPSSAAANLPIAKDILDFVFVVYRNDSLHVRTAGGCGRRLRGHFYGSRVVLMILTSNGK